VTVTIRPDLAEAHERTWESLASAGTWWSARQRRELAETAIAAVWEGRDGAPAGGNEAPAAAHSAVARLASGSPAVTKDWYEAVRDEIGALEYVELVGLVATAAAATSLRNSLGLPPRELPAAADGEPSRVPPPPLADAALNWVPVAAPADETAAVVQALTAVPATFDDLWRLADAQYIPDAEMVDLRWTRGTLSRVEIELVATRVSFSRECHY
jgi:alkylhydroperoxidase family enzyme